MKAALASWMTLCASTVFAQEEPPRPTEHHEHLRAYVGTWDAVTKFPQGKDAPDSEGVETNILACGGLFLVSNLKSEMMGREFQGHGIQGYDTAKKKYVGVWVDSWGTQIDFSEGECDRTGKVHTWRTKGAGEIEWKLVSEMKDNDNRVFTIYTLEGGKESPMMVTTYRRRK